MSDDMPVGDALEQVRRLQAVVRDRLRFRGFSARARAAGGLGALLAALVLQRAPIPATPHAHLLAWCAVGVVAVAVNYGALLFWLSGDSRWRRLEDWVPVLESLPPLAAGAGLTWALVRGGAYDLLPGAWMICYGLVHMVYRRNLHPAVYGVGLYYLLAGLVFLVRTGVPFTDPRPMGLVFGLGELAGGLALSLPDRLSEPARQESEP